MTDKKYATVRLGKSSVTNINAVCSAKLGKQQPPLSFVVECTQVQKEIEDGSYALIWLGSDNNDGRPTSWKQGLRAIGIITNVQRSGPSFNDQVVLHLKIHVILPDSVMKKDLLAKAPTAYYWFSGLPVIGIDDYANQTVRYINQDAERSDIRALFYAIEAVYPGFRQDVNQTLPELAGLFQYTPPEPSITKTRLHEVADIKMLNNDETALVSEHLPAEWVISLCSKNLLIVTGASGTGKSKTARDLARSLDYSLPQEHADSKTNPANCLAFIPVAANWTNSNPIFGFVNPFGAEITWTEKDGTSRTGNECYEVQPAVLLMLRAISMPEQPHFLVLDEMNLSQVERYFYQLLSAMETNRGMDSNSKVEIIDVSGVKLIARTLEAQNRCSLERLTAQKLASAGRGLVFPPNVFIIGTVNVDETTYMFSPKVLDRAHVLEERGQDPGAYFRNEILETGNVIPRDHAMAMFRNAISRNKGGFWERKKPIEILTEVADRIGLGAVDFDAIRIAMEKTIVGINTLIEPVGFGPHYRPINEFASYIAVYLEMNDPKIFGNEGWKGALDRAVLQKFLAKIHGNRRQLGQSLQALSAFLQGQDAQAASYTIGTKRIGIRSGEELEFSLPLSAEKVAHMHRRLETTGYTTFVE